jgi:hypothetical protein
LTGSEIDDVITTVLAGFELAAERRRRADWRTRELAASHFVAEYGHADDAAAPHPVQDRLE